MRTTTRWGFTVPSLGTDLDDIPSHLGAFGDAVDALVAAFKHGPYSSLPAAGHVDTYYYVDSGGTNQGGLYRDNGASWDRLNVVINNNTGSLVTTAAFGDTSAAGNSSQAAAGNHRHGMPANPLTAHLAASNPHPQYLLGQGAGSYYEALVALGNMGATPTFDLATATQFSGTINANITAMTLANPAASGNRQQIGIYLLKDNTATAYTIAWPASFDWGTAGAPATPAQNKGIFISGFTDDGGSHWRMVNAGFGGF